MSSRSPPSLCATLVGGACNIGLEPVVRPEIAALRRDRLSWVNQNFIRPETIAAANAAIVAAHNRLDIVRHWGAGEVASADGMRFVAPSSRSEEHTSELQSLMRISYAVFCLKTKNKNRINIA